MSNSTGPQIQELLEIIDKKKLPRHIAIIMDGNGRWALKRGLPRVFGHIAGVESLKDIVEICCDLKIQVLTVYAFSNENWKRPQEEIDALMHLLITFLNKEIQELCRKKVRVNPTGRLKEFPVPVQKVLAMAVKQSRKNSGLILNLALNYGGHLEIVDAMRAIASDIEAGHLKADQINVQTVADHLYNANQPYPDLLIRTSGEFRLSNFLLWQLAYTEIWFTEVLWPDFRRLQFLQALADYQRRERRFGGLKLK